MKEVNDLKKKLHEYIEKFGTLDKKTIEISKILDIEIVREQQVIYNKFVTC